MSMGLDDKIQLLKISASALHGMKKSGVVFLFVDVVAVSDGGSEPSSGQKLLEGYKKRLVDEGFEPGYIL